jgi:ABC-2 type transport system ATP-binding protein
MTSAVHRAVVHLGATCALDDVSVEVGPGEVVAVVGGDGAGKTTLLRTLVGEIVLDSGTVRAPDAHEIGYLPASSGSWAALTVRQNLDFVGGIYGLVGSRLEARRDNLLERTDLVDARDRLASQLSGGMRRKLGFAMAMLHEPSLLVLDEPSTGVDPVSRIDLWRLVSEAAAGGAAVLMSTTYLDEAERAARLLALDDGHVLAEGTLDDVLASLPGTVTVSDRRHDGARSWRRAAQHHEHWLVGEAVPVDARSVQPDLEDAVIALSMLHRATAAGAA